MESIQLTRQLLWAMLQLGVGFMLVAWVADAISNWALGKHVMVDSSRNVMLRVLLVGCFFWATYAWISGQTMVLAHDIWARMG